MASPQARFAPAGLFHSALKERVALHFAGRASSGQGSDTHGGGRMLRKSALLFAWLLASYCAVMFAPVTWWQAALLVVSIALAQAGIGFNVLHDANHGSYSGSARLNRALGWLGCDLIGASSLNWKQRHNVLHHTYTNIEGLDDDLEAGPMLRFAPWQKRRPVHRLQHLYVWGLFALFPVRWFFIDDFRELFARQIGSRPYPRPRGAALFWMLLGKAGYYTWAVALPLALHPAWKVGALWLLGSAVLGNTLALVFQLAHCTGDAEFHFTSEGQVAGWAEHKVATTVDFAKGSRLLTWYLGGLNFQVEHHLFPRICHLHYPALARIVEETCVEHGVKYRSQPTLLAALRANVRWLRALGAAEAPLPATLPAPAVAAAA